MIEHTCHPLPQQQVAMDSKERGHPISLTQFPFFPLLSGKNTGIFLKVFVHGKCSGLVQKWTAIFCFAK